MNDPRYVVFAMVDEPKGRKETFGYATGGWVCAPAVRRIVERMAPLVGMTPRPDFPEWEAGTELIIQASAKGSAFATE